MENYRAEVAKVEDTSYSPAKKRRDYKKTRHTVGFDVERKAYEMWGVNVFEIPGISHLTALELMSELGHDFTRKFPVFQTVLLLVQHLTEHQDIRRKKNIKPRATPSEQCRVDF